MKILRSSDYYKLSVNSNNYYILDIINKTKCKIDNDITAFLLELSDLKFNYTCCSITIISE
jgi:hypothetical protein